MFYTYRELSNFIYVTPFEIFLFLISLTISSFLLTVKLISDSSYALLTWSTVLSPLFISDAISAYFCVIIFIRHYKTGAFKAAFIRAFFSLKRVCLLFVFKLLLAYKLDDNYAINYSEVFLPIFYIILLLVCRAFRL